LRDAASGCPALHRRRRVRLARKALEVSRHAPQFLGDKGIGGIVSGPAAMLGLALEKLLCGHGTSSCVFLLFASGGALYNVPCDVRFRLKVRLN
jgi:hypothetical protein